MAAELTRSRWLSVRAMIKSRLKIETPCGVLLVAPIEELEVLQSKATAEELKSVEGISAPSRRRERLAWRILLREFLAETGADAGAVETAVVAVEGGTDADVAETAVAVVERGAETEARVVASDFRIEYAASGAPQIINSDFSYISVSHSRTHVAVMLSLRACGVDIESVERNFDRVADRYISAEERALSCEEWWPAAIWAAKEALYKMIQREGVDLRRDLRIINFDATTCNISAIILGRESVTLRLERHSDQVLVYTL